jgi:hypothetical protein
MIWCYFNNRLAQHGSAFAVRPQWGEIFRIIGSTIPT